MNFAYDYRLIDSEYCDVRFIGMNTADGFRWCLDGLPKERDLKRTYIIKGAAGTGKSTLMKTVADRFESGGNRVVRFLCSSDPDSLDAVLIGDGILILDGTAPHVKDALYPGALSELVCLGNFWNKDKLICRSSEIVDLSEKKACCFRKAYRFMSGMRQLSLDIFEDAESTLDVPKIKNVISRIVGRMKRNDGVPVYSETIIRSFGMKGTVKLTTLDNRAKSVTTVSDTYGTGRVFMSLLSEELKKAGISFVCSPDPLFASQISDIFVPGEGLLFSVDRTDKTDKFINMERFVLKEKLGTKRGEIRLAYKCWDALRRDAETELCEAAGYHFELERIYGAAMNFDAVTAYRKLLIRDIENRL
ncbi:MAG: hypothetical protein IJK58_05160 [Clostridia bacterium]|nr:hypothetical protein [Clostridia bacterium]